MTYFRTLGQVLLGGIFGYLVALPIAWLMERIGLRGFVGDIVTLVVVLICVATVLWMLTPKGKG